MADNIPAWAQMWLLAILIYSASKAVVWMRLRDCSAPCWRQAAFLFAWPGMDANAFVCHRGDCLAPRIASRDSWWATASMAIGAFLFWFVAHRVTDESVALIAWLGMIGTTLMLHFGVFRLLANFWRARGVDAQPIMNAPWAASSVSEFWGKRWNTGFRDLAAQCIFRPVSRRAGVAIATWAAFLFSGIVHDLVISLPAGAGYGRPTLYFLLQALVVQFERSHLARRTVLRHPIARRGFAFIAVLAPVNLLFHAPFRTNVVIPFVEALGVR